MKNKCDMNQLLRQNNSFILARKDTCKDCELEHLQSCNSSPPKNGIDLKYHFYNHFEIIYQLFIIVFIYWYLLSFIKNIIFIL